MNESNREVVQLQTVQVDGLQVEDRDSQCLANRFERFDVGIQPQLVGKRLKLTGRVQNLSGSLQI